MDTRENLVTQVEDLTTEEIRKQAELQQLKDAILRLHDQEEVKKAYERLRAIKLRGYRIERRKKRLAANKSRRRNRE